MTRRWAMVIGLTAVGAASAADPVVVRLTDTASPPAGVVTVGHVAKLTGGPARTRERVAELDLADRADASPVTKRQVEYRLRLAGLTDADFVLVGASQVALAAAPKRLTEEKVVAAAKAELVRRLGVPAERLFVDQVAPVLVQLPEVRPGDDVEYVAAPNGGTARMGRTQMNVTVRVNGEHRMALPVHLNAAAVPAGLAGAEKVAPPPAGVLVPAAAPDPAAAGVKARQRVTLRVRSGDLLVTAAGEAMHDARVGEPVKVTNVDSKKVVTGTVSGPGTVDLELGGDR